MTGGAEWIVGKDKNDDTSNLIKAVRAFDLVICERQMTLFIVINRLEYGVRARACWTAIMQCEPNEMAFPLR